MKIWTQMEYDQTKGSLGGFTELGTGDFRAVDFRRRCRVEIGENSILGDDVHLGEFARVGAHTEVGDRCSVGAFSTIGDRCKFGRGAHMHVDVKIGRGTTFRDDVQIEEGVEIGDGVVLPDLCRLFGVAADGKSFFKMTPVEGSTLYAFVGEYKDGEKHVFVYQRGTLWLIEEYHQLAVNICKSQCIQPQGLDMLAAARYLEERFAKAISSI